MKMSKDSYNLIAEVFEENREVIKNHRHRLREKGNYQNLEVRLAFDAYNGLMSLNERRDIAEKDNLKDLHIQTALLKIMRDYEI